MENDNYYEWIELYNPTNISVNVTGWSITDNSAEDFLEGDFEHCNGTRIIPPFGYALITDHGTKFYDNYSTPNSTINLYIDDSAIGNGLGNSGDKLILKNNQNKTVDYVEWILNYTDVPGQPASEVKENCTLARISDIDKNDSSEDFYESIEPTPGYKNKIIEEGITKISCNAKSFLIRKNEILEISLNVKNCGKFFDNITLKIVSISQGWFAEFKNKTLSLNPNESADASMLVSPCEINGCSNGIITVFAESEKEYNESDGIDLSFEILAPELTIREIKIYNEKDLYTNNFGEGEIARIKAFLKNYGEENASNVKVNFYLDKIDLDCFIGCKYYDSVGKYQKYPSIQWDTQGVLPGKHDILVMVDEDNDIDEIDETNNMLSLQVEVLDTLPNTIGRSIVITDVYYHSRPGLFNEFISIYNPTDADFNLSGWYLTNEPFEIKEEQTKIIFPNDTIIHAKSKLVLSENSSRNEWETGKKSDFEYNYDSEDMIPQMISTKKFIMSNNGAAIALKDTYNHTIDFVTYGNTSLHNDFWDGLSIPFSGEGVVLKRNFGKNGLPVDTNTCFDWVSDKPYIIGQSDFSYEKISINGEITTFVSPDCSFDAIVSEIRKANSSIYLNIYEFTDPFLCDELIKALIRGVSVNIFLEGSPIGGVSDEEKYVLSRIKNYGGNIRFIASGTDDKVYARYIFNHGKYLVIDKKTVIVESCNWAKTGIPKNPTYGNREWGIIIRNDYVAEYFLKVFLDDWNPDRCDSYSFDAMNLSVPPDFYMDDSFYRSTYEPQFESRTFTGNFSTIPVFSPDTSYRAICNLIDSANESIYIEQLYIYRDWKNGINPFVQHIVNKSNQNIDVKVILNYNPTYDSTNDKINLTKQYLEDNSIEVKFIYTNWSYFSNVHNKGVIVDNKSVLISSINWNENSVTRNREAGIIIENNEVAQYYADVFLYDWGLNSPKPQNKEVERLSAEEFDKNTIYIAVIFTLTFALIARDWRKRQWT